MEIRIHDLLDGLEDSSVPMEETGVVSSTRIKELTRMKIEQTETVSAPRHPSRKRVITLALAAALVIAFGITAYSAGSVLFGWGGNVEIRSEQTNSGIENTIYVHTENMTEPVSFEDGRMFFVVNDEHIDITDQVSETEPYLYDYADEEGVIHYWIIGKKRPRAGTLRLRGVPAAAGGPVDSRLCSPYEQQRGPLAGQSPGRARL